MKDSFFDLVKIRVNSCKASFLRFGVWDFPGGPICSLKSKPFSKNMSVGHYNTLACRTSTRPTNSGRHGTYLNRRSCDRKRSKSGMLPKSTKSNLFKKIACEIFHDQAVSPGFRPKSRSKVGLNPRDLVSLRAGFCAKCDYSASFSSGWHLPAPRASAKALS